MKTHFQVTYYYDRTKQTFEIIAKRQVKTLTGQFQAALQEIWRKAKQNVNQIKE